jgi:allantoate deiminase
LVLGVNQSSPPNDLGTASRSGERLPETVADTLDALADIGRTSEGGTTRVAWAPELFAAYDWIGKRMRGLGLEVEIDPAGNLIGRWHVGAGAPVVVGSHLDTVPSGGAFDGAYGVVAALHAVRLLQEQSFEPDRPVWVVAFMDEEGTRFGTALFGSRAFVGEDVAGFGDRTDGDGISLRDAMREAGFDFERVPAAAAVSEIAAYLELHVEQGPVLEAEGLDIGIVTSVVGLRGYRVRLRGQANHAGTTPMELRRDALAGAARIALALREFARGHADLTATVGKLSVAPGGANVVPGHADFTVDARAATSDGIAAVESSVEHIVSSIANEEALDAVLESTFTLEPVQLDADLMAAVQRAAQAEGAASKRMPSGAGHDAMLVARHVPAAIVFVPSRDGMSHVPEEYTAPEHLESGMRVLAATLRQILRQER